ncbi:MAG: ACT domain-containing protein [Planctomycetes bacterium]|nr:ACT domain-containing protein [Planctomycetota bacterium]
METKHPHAFVLNVVADDRPGIVAAVSGPVAQRGGNIDACSQTVVAGYFTLIMVVSFPQPVDTDALRDAIAACRAAGASTALNVHIGPYTPCRQPIIADGEHFVLTAFGGDAEGVTYKFARFLADKGINIADLYGLREGDQFVLIGQLCIPAGWDIEMLQAELEHLAASIGQTVRLQHENLFVATNQLRFPLTRRPGRRMDAC